MSEEENGDEEENGNGFDVGGLSPEDQAALEDELDESWDELDQEEKDAYGLDDDDWDDLSLQEKYDLLQEDAPEDGDDGPPGERAQLDDGPAVSPGEGQAGLGSDIIDGVDTNPEMGGIEYVGEYLPEEPSDMTIGNVRLRGTVRVEETGSGYTERYKAERERESGGEDTADEPEAAELQVEAWGTQTDWEQLNLMREQRDPFPVSIGPFVFEEMGIASVEQTIDGRYGPAPREIIIDLTEFRELIVQRDSMSDVMGGGSDGGAGGGTPGEVQGPEAGDTTYSGTPRSMPGGGTLPVGDGETFGGELIDTGNSGNPKVIPRGNGWVIENVGLTGSWIGGGGTTGDQFMPVTVGGSCAIRHVFAGEGAGGNISGCIFVHRSSSGSLEIRRVNIQGWDDNGMYMADPLRNGACQVEIVDSYAHNNQTSDYRGPTNLLVNNCVGIRDDSAGRGRRNIWVRSGGTVEVRDCDLIMTPGTSVHVDGGSTCNITGDTQITGGTTGSTSGSFGTNPDPQGYHSGIPGSADEAAEGVGAGE